MRIYLVSILVTLFFISCEDEKIEGLVEIEKENPLGFCDNEIALLKSDAEEEIVFDFEQCMKSIKENQKCEQIEFIEKQTDIDLCNGRNEFAANFNISNNKSINLTLITEKNCDGNYSYPIRLDNIIEILINGDSKILLEGEYVSNIGSLDLRVNETIQKEIDDGYYPVHGKAMFSIQWDSKTPLKDRISVFENTVKGYLLAANKMSQSKFDKEICNLTDYELLEIKKMYKICYSIKDNGVPIIKSN